jgi:hypothetical protein
MGCRFPRKERQVPTGATCTVLRAGHYQISYIIYYVPDLPQ